MSFVLLSNNIAQTMDIKELSKLSLEELMDVKVITASKSEQMLKETSAMTFLITDIMIKEKGFFDLMDVLNSLPYFQIQSEHGHWTKGGIVNLRGNRSGDSGNNKVLLLVDGIKLSDDAGEGLYMGLNSIPLNSIKQIEVVYGPNSTLYGRDAYAGMINLITKKSDSKYAGYSYGSFNSERIYAGITHNFNENIKANIHIYSYSSDEQDPTNISKTYREREYYPTKPYTENFYRASKNTMIDLGFSFYGLSVKYLLFDNLGSETYGTNPNLYVTEYSTLLGIKNKIFSVKYNLNFLNNFAISFDYCYKLNEFNPMTANLYIDDLNRTDNLDSSLQVDPFYAYGGRKYYYFRTKSHKGEIKSEYRISENVKNVSGVGFDFVYGIPVISEGKGGNEFTTNIQKEKHEHYFSTYGIFTEFSYRTPWQILFTFGGRLDINSLYGSTFMPRFATIYEYHSNIFKLIYSRGFLAPSTTQVYFESQTTFSWIQKNENLEPETISSIEFIWDYIDNNFRIGTNVFYNQLSNIISESIETGDSAKIQVSNDSYFVPILQSQNISNGERYGFNLFVTKKIGSYFETSLNYSLILGNDLYCDDKINVNDNLVSNHKINLGVSFSHSYFSFYSEAIWLSSKSIKSNHDLSEYSQFLDENGYLNFDSYLLINLNLRLNNIYNSLSLYCRIKNILNTEYYGQTINAHWGSPMILQDLRRIDFGVEFNFN